MKLDSQVWLRAFTALLVIAIAQGCDAAGNGSTSVVAARPALGAVLPPTTSAAPAMPVAAGERLVPPPGFTLAVVQSDKDTHACPTDATPFTGALDFPSRYEGSDKARDDVNPEAEKKYKQLIAPISALERGLSQQVDDYMRTANAGSLDCARRLLKDWSAANGLMGESVTHTGKSMRKWAMASITAAYLRLKFSESQPLAGDAPLVRAVDGWLDKMASRVVEEWRDAPIEKMNNHEYWAAWAVMAASVAVNRRDLFDWSMHQFETAASQVDGDGYLPNELARDTRALQYHNFALTPLTMIAAFAKANGVEPGGRERAALARLSDRVLVGIGDPGIFTRKTGKTQITADLSDRSKLAWLEPYCWTFSCGSDLQKRLADSRPLKSYRLGGNLTDIFHPSPAHRVSGADETDSVSSSSGSVSELLPFPS